MSMTLTNGDDNWTGWFDWEDTVFAKDGDDTLDGAGGDDVIWAGLGDDHVKGGQGDDSLHGDDGSETGSTPEDGDDDLDGGAGNDGLFGGGGNDVLNGGSGIDRMFGGNGNDIYYVDNVGDTAVENFTDAKGSFVFSGVDKVCSTVTFTLGSGLENLTLQGIGAIDGTGNELDNVMRGNGSANILDGKGGSDHLYGNAGEDALLGGGGDDFLYGGSDDDFLTGGLDDDTLDGGSGADEMFGGSGNDIYFVDNVGDVVSEFLGSGDDTVFSTISFTLVSGIEGLVLEGGDDAIDGTGNTLDNTISGNDGANTLRGLDGDDVLAGGRGDDHLFGGRNDDSLFGNEDDDVLDGGTGNDFMAGGTGNDTYMVDSVSDAIEELAGEGIDTVNVSQLVSFTLGGNLENLNLLTGINGTGNFLDNVITGNLLDNVLDGRRGSDTLDGGLGSDTASYASASGRVIVTLGANGADGTALETATSINIPETILSTDTLRSIENVLGSGFGDDITGNELDNRIDGGGGRDTMRGGRGNDTYIVDNAGDLVIEVAGQGTDRVQTSVSYALSLGSAVEVLETTNASAFVATNLTGNEFVNTITGNIANNVINGGGGADTMVGLRGDDTYVVDNAGDKVVEALSEGQDTVLTSVSYALAADSDVEILKTTDDSGTAAINLTGNAGFNTIIGNNGDNIIAGGTGSDTLDGRGGIDTVSYAAHDGAVSIGLGSNGVDGAAFKLIGTSQSELDGIDTLRSIENVKGSAFSDTIFGNERDNVLDGGGSTDTMRGLAGNDTYVIDNSFDIVVENANEGIDTIVSSVNAGLVANVENLTLAGAAPLNAVGNELGNIITGNAGVNLMDGGAGADTLVGGGNNDVFIFGIGQANGDTVVDFNGNGAAAGDSIVFSGYGPGATFTQIDAQHWVVNYHGGVDHDFLTFANAAAIDRGDFVFV